jgi:iron complex outermembrane receptor protein
MLCCGIVAIHPGLSAGAETAGSDAATMQQELPQVIVIGNAPLEGFGLPLNQIPSNAQTASGADLQRQQSLDVVDYLNNNFSGVNVSESAGNPFQIDVYYHGFTASPLLGTPEGLSVYIDGVRVNESFGDTVNWDLVPEYAINTVSLIPIPSSGSIRSAAHCR